MINQRLFDWYGIDTTKNLDLPTFCSRPYDTVLIDQQGSCYVCECTAWLPQSIGNLQIQPLKTILNNATHQHLQSSIANHSYSYCNQKQCSYLKRSHQFDVALPKSQIKHIRLAIDNSCNLRCPSCRNNKIFHSRGRELTRIKKLADQVLEFIHELKHSVNVHIGSDGDPFASLVYRYFMRQVPDTDLHTYTVMTNGLLIEKQYRVAETVFRNLKELHISMDGATKKTYEKLRLGGKWEQIKKNLNFLQQHKTFDVYLHMVVQNDNWKEIPEMLNLCDEYGFNAVYFNRIENWNTNLDWSVQDFDSTKNFVDMMADVKHHPKIRGTILN